MLTQSLCSLASPFLCRVLFNFLLALPKACAQNLQFDTSPKRLYFTSYQPPLLLGFILRRGEPWTRLRPGHLLLQLDRLAFFTCATPSCVNPKVRLCLFRRPLFAFVGAQFIIDLPLDPEAGRVRPEGCKNGDALFENAHFTIEFTILLVAPRDFLLVCPESCPTKRPGHYVNLTLGCISDKSYSTPFTSGHLPRLYRGAPP